MDIKAIMDTFLANLVAELGDQPMCAKSLMPGASINGEYVAECGGFAWVRLMTVSMSASFPAPVTSPDNCAYGLAIPVEMGIIRRAPLPQQVAQRVILPTSEQNREAARKQYDDIEVMRRTLLRNQRVVDDFVAGTYVPVGPESGVVGGSWPFTFGLD